VRYKFFKCLKLQYSVIGCRLEYGDNIKIEKKCYALGQGGLTCLIL